MAITNMRIYLTNPVDADRLALVKNEMITRGPPTVVVYRINATAALALHGSHRLTAARDLGIIPLLTFLDASNDDDDFDLHVQSELPDSTMRTTVGEVVRGLFDLHRSQGWSEYVVF